MKQEHPFERDHVFCGVCGERMKAVTHYKPKRFCRKTGVEQPIEQSHVTWECPTYPSNHDHDREHMQ